MNQNPSFDGKTNTKPLSNPSKGNPWMIPPSQQPSGPALAARVHEWPHQQGI